MTLNHDTLSSMQSYENLDVRVPDFDRESMINTTAEEPIWVHFGAGNLFKSFISVLQQELLEQGLAEKGIIAAFAIEPETIDNVWKPNDNLSLRVTMNSDGSSERLVVASVSECVYADRSSDDWSRLVEIFRSESLQMVSFTITEKGYDPCGKAMGIIRELLIERRKSGATPIALVSMDNCVNNSDVLRAGIGDAVDYEGLSFPLTMIDKITPRPNEDIRAKLEAEGFSGLDIYVTEIGTYASLFANTEKRQYLVVEDNFPNGRPPLEHAGVIFTNRKTAYLSERMKVGALLNPLHFSVAVFGMLLGYDNMADASRDADINRMITCMGYEEQLPIVVDPIIINPQDFLDECISIRFTNTFLPDSPARILTDASKKIPARFRDTIETYYIEHPQCLDDLRMIPLLIAGWLRYLMAIDDNGNPFELSPDPLLNEHKDEMSGIALGQPNYARECCRKLIQILDLGIDLYETPLGAATEEWLVKLTESHGAIRKTLRLIKAKPC